jgi:hypothetical protein
MSTPPLYAAEFVEVRPRTPTDALRALDAVASRLAVASDLGRVNSATSIHAMSATIYHATATLSETIRQARLILTDGPRL